MVVEVGCDAYGGDDNEVLMVMEVEWGECVDMVVEVEDSAFSDVVLE